MAIVRSRVRSGWSIRAREQPTPKEKRPSLTILDGRLQLFSFRTMTKGKLWTDSVAMHAHSSDCATIERWPRYRAARIN
jgi:hypothetical protein